MCRSIVTLRRPDPATHEEAYAVEEITDSVERLLGSLHSRT